MGKLLSNDGTTIWTKRQKESIRRQGDFQFTDRLNYLELKMHIIFKFCDGKKAWIHQIDHSYELSAH